MKQPPRQRTIKDERDEKIGKDAKVYAFEWIIAITQVLTIMCIIKVQITLKRNASSATAERLFHF